MSTLDIIDEGEWFMGFLDSTADGCFQVDEQEITHFYPLGKLSSGYIVESDVRKEEIHRFVKKMMTVYGIGFIFIQLFFGVIFSIAFMVLYLIWYHFAAKAQAKGLEQSTRKLNLFDVYKNQAKSFNIWILILAEIMITSLAIFFTWSLIDTTRADFWFPVISLSILSILLFLMIILKLKK
jgi:hypothetical protein